jgi:hypothetical protein
MNKTVLESSRCHASAIIGDFNMKRYKQGIDDENDVNNISSVSNLIFAREISKLEEHKYDFCFIYYYYLFV